MKRLQSEEKAAAEDEKSDAGDFHEVGDNAAPDATDKSVVEAESAVTDHRVRPIRSTKPIERWTYDSWK
jgi:hypothetical protein